jgi:hypothetical protein
VVTVCGIWTFVSSLITLYMVSLVRGANG